MENGYSKGLSLEDAFMFRLRVGGQSGNYVWQAHLDTDGDASNVEWILQLVQSSGGSNRVELVRTDVGGTTLQQVTTGTNTASWTGSSLEFSRWSAITNTSHYHVEIAVPWSSFSAITGVTNIHLIRALLATSSTHSGINKDAPLDLPLTEQISNALSESIPEPAVATLLIGAGGGIPAYWEELYFGGATNAMASLDSDHDGSTTTANTLL